jgi:hypothetical protein
VAGVFHGGERALTRPLLLFESTRIQNNRGPTISQGIRQIFSKHGTRTSSSLRFGLMMALPLCVTQESSIDTFTKWDLSYKSLVSGRFRLLVAPWFLKN